MEGQEGTKSHGHEQFDANIMGSGNNDNILVDGNLEEGLPNTPDNNKGKMKKIYNRHTPQQIEELEKFFKNCAHPDEKQRQDIATRLGLESKQVLFWFQNHRTQMKFQTARQENIALKHEYDKIMAENIALKEAITNQVCQNCGGPTIPGEKSMELNTLRVENARLKDELSRLSGDFERVLGKPVYDLLGPISFHNSNLNSEQPKGKAALNEPISSPTPLSMGLNLDHEASNSNTMTTSINGEVSTKLENSIYIQVAMAAMNELVAMARSDSPLWAKGLDNGKDMLNHDEYVKNFSGGVMGIKPWGFITDASRETSSVFITSLELMKTMMIPGQWKELFPCMVSKATTVEVLCSGLDGTCDGELQLMDVEFVFPSPLVPFHKGKLMRLCKKQCEGMWALVDVSVDMIQEPSFSGSSIKWRRLPSGCIVKDIADGYSLVTWIEHLEYDEHCIPQLYRQLMRSGMACGALKWLSTLQRELDCSANFMSSRIYPDDTPVRAVTQEGRRSILKLMRRISNNFFSGLCASSECCWQKLQVGRLVADVCATRRVSIDKPDELSGVPLCVSTSIWIPMPKEELFEFLRDEKNRGKWDLLANGGPMEVIARFDTSHGGNNSISLLCPLAASSRDSNMLILQESWSDQTGSSIVYAPVDSSSVETVLNGGDSEYLALLPSGFTVSDAPEDPNLITAKSDDNNNGGGCALTIGFQILINGDPPTELSVESINSVNGLMFRTIKKITTSLGIN